MKRTFIFIVMAFLMVGSLAFGEVATIIDFTKLDADTEVEVSVAEGDSRVIKENGRTIMDFGAVAGATFTPKQKDLMKTSLSLPNWEVVLNSSARNVTSVSESTVLPASVSQNSTSRFAGKNVMGVRVVFPASSVNSNAKIVPAYEIPAYEPLKTADETGKLRDLTEEEMNAEVNNVGKTRFEGGYGVVKNVGTIKSLSVSTLGMNFPHALYVLLKDTDGIERRYFMGYLGFDGWKELKWNNPTYITEVRTREIRIVPIYPRGLPFVKFVGLQITRDALHEGNDFVGYFGDVKIIYDKAVLNTERDIADEGLWGIVTQRENDKQTYEMSLFGEKQVTRFLEKEKMAPASQMFEQSAPAEESAAQPAAAGQ